MKSFNTLKIILSAVICSICLKANGQEWSTGGRKLALFPGLNQAEYARQYQLNKTYWDKAIAFLANTNLDTLSVGKHIIDGDNVFASVSEGTTKEYNYTNWESHRDYLDIHLVLTGKERIGLMDAAKAEVTNPYDATKDVINYDVNLKGNYYVADNNTLLIFFPQDAHRPGIHMDGFDKVKKLVFKIKAAK